MASESRRRRVAKRRTDPRGRIEGLFVENFKSYAGRHQIGPFDKFTCIIGPNGAGKSNVMDAISFCLGISAKHLRGDKLKDLVYRREEESPASNARSAHVTIAFRTARGDVVHFSRSIDARGSGAYRYGPPDKTAPVTYEEFTQRLGEHHIHVKARNFLVFQGDVMDLARRQGTDLAGALETISGSDMLRDRYKKLAHEVELTQARARLDFQAHREVEAALSVLEKQREEVERYHQLREQRSRLASETVLFKLYCIEREEDRQRAAAEAIAGEAAAHEASLRALRKDVEDLEHNRRVVEAEAEKARSHFFVLSSNLEQLRPEIQKCKKQSAYWAKKLQEAEGQVAQEEQRLQGLRDAARRAREDCAKAEAQLQALRARPVEVALSLTAPQRAEYEAAAARIDVVNVRQREKIREVEEQVAEWGRELADCRVDLKALEEQQVRGQTRLEELRKEKASLKLELDREEAARAGQEQQLHALQNDLTKFQMFKDSLAQERSSLRFGLDAAQAKRERLEQVEARQRVADELRSRFPDVVLGRLSELVVPLQRRFELALQMSLGGMAEAIVVTSSKGGRDCVMYLKERRIATETFLPLDRMEAPKVGPVHALAHGSETRRLAADCVEHNEKFFSRHEHWQGEGPVLLDKVLAFLLGGTIIVDDLEEAKRAAYHDARKRNLAPRVVTLDGEVVEPNGNMSVQSAASLGRVEFGGVEQLQEIKEKERRLIEVEQDFATLEEAEVQKRQQETDLLESCGRMKAKADGLRQRLREVEAEQGAQNQLLRDRAGRAEELRVRIRRATDKAAELERQKETMEADLLKVGKKYFEKLNRELGVDDVREVIRREQRERKRLRDEVEQTEDLVRGLRAEELSIEQRAKATSKLVALKEECDKTRRDIAENQERQGQLEEKERTREEHLRVSEAQVKAATEKRDAVEREVKAKKAELQGARAFSDESRKKLKFQSDKIRVLLGMKCGVFRDCNERQIDIPLVGGRDESLVERVVLRERDLDEMPIQELEAACAALRVDYEHLPLDRREVAERTKVTEARAAEQDYEAQITEINRELAALSPNMRAVEQCHQEAARLKELHAKAEQSHQECQNLTLQFQAVKAERTQLFLKCFRHVEARVLPFYKELTSYDGNEGGSAYLDLDDTEEPYNGGITFTACPPGKRFFPMELLSGGERSMASMALLFAMHSYHPPPFMILDEVDAPFDRKNTNSLVSYLRKLDFQCLVISLKDTFFSHSDSIVGIYKDKEKQTSGCLSLALDRLGQEAVRRRGGGSENPETEVPLAEALDVD